MFAERVPDILGIAKICKITSAKEAGSWAIHVVCLRKPLVSFEEYAQPIGAAVQLQDLRLRWWSDSGAEQETIAVTDFPHSFLPQRILTREIVVERKNCVTAANLVASQCFVQVGPLNWFLAQAVDKLRNCNLKGTEGIATLHLAQRRRP